MLLNLIDGQEYTNNHWMMNCVLYDTIVPHNGLYSSAKFQVDTIPLLLCHSVLLRIVEYDT